MSMTRTVHTSSADRIEFDAIMTTENCESMQTKWSIEYLIMVSQQTASMHTCSIGASKLNDCKVISLPEKQQKHHEVNMKTPVFAKLAIYLCCCLL